MSQVNGKWSGLTVPKKRAQLALNALRRIASMNGAASWVARDALKEIAAVKPAEGEKP